jgi:hypothetical protein
MRHLASWHRNLAHSARDLPSPFNAEICFDQTPRGRVTSIANRRILAELSAAQGSNNSIERSISWAIAGRTANQAHSRTPKCSSLANGRTRSSMPSRLGDSIVIQYAAQPRTVSDVVVKHFCAVCGSNLISTYDRDPTKIGLPLGGLEQAPTNVPEGHIFVESKSPWFRITDNLPQHDGWPGAEAKVREISGDTDE